MDGEQHVLHRILDVAGFPEAARREYPQKRRHVFQQHPIGLPVAVLYSANSWRAKPLWMWTKVWNTLLVLAFAGYTAFLLNWHLLNVRLNY